MIANNWRPRWWTRHYWRRGQRQQHPQITNPIRARLLSKRNSQTQIRRSKRRPRILPSRLLLWTKGYRQLVTDPYPTHNLPCEMIEILIHIIVGGQVSYLLKNVSELSTSVLNLLYSLWVGYDSNLFSWRPLHLYANLNALLRYFLWLQSLYPTPASALFIHYRLIQSKSWGYCHWCFVGCSSYDQDC